MTKTGIIALLVLILAVGAGMYFIFSKKGIEALSSQPEILLYVEEGDVSYRLPGAIFQRATTSPLSIVTGTEVHTGIGKATVLFPNNSSVVLDTYTELTVNYEENKVSLLQTLGTTYHRVSSLVTGSSYEVETPGTLAAVRGTKFAVKYDKKTKVTKVAVSESKVDVSKWKARTGTTTKEILEKIELSEGKTTRVEESASTTTRLVVVEISEDQEMSAWIEKNRSRDAAEKALLERLKTGSEIREGIKQLLEERRDVETKGTDTETRTETEVKTETKTEARQPVQEETVPPKATETKPKLPETKPASTTQEPRAIPVIKLSEEVFFDKFTDMFMNNFYLDERDSPCTVRLTASERVKVVSDFATQSGWPFKSATLLSFAQEIDTYCKVKNPELKIKLQGRFDAEFPFQENI